MADKLQEIFEDLMSRFIINVPESERATTDRICFQIEQAHWYYEDFFRQADSKLPGYTLKKFAAEMFQRCPVITDLVGDNPNAAIEEIYSRFVAYKMHIPVCGAIILNEHLNKMLLVKGWTSKSSWTFPKGKINQDETEMNCAIREVMEEVGFDVSSLIKENDYIEQMLRGEQRNRLYIIPNVSENTPFAPQTRKEISDIKWHWLKDMPGYRYPSGECNGQNGKFYMVRNFIGPLQHWIEKFRRTPKKQRQKSNKGASTASLSRNTSKESLLQPAATPEQAKSVLKSMLGINDASAPLPASPSPAVVSSTALMQHHPSSSPLAVPHHRAPTSRNLLDYFGTSPSSSLPLQPSLSASFPHSSGGSLDSSALHQRPPFMNHQASLLSLLNSSGAPTMSGSSSLNVMSAGAMRPTAWHATQSGTPQQAFVAPLPFPPTSSLAAGNQPAPPVLTQQQSLLHILHGGSIPAVPSVTQPDASASAMLTHEHTSSDHLKDLLGLARGSSVQPDPLMSSVSSDAARKPPHTTPIKKNEAIVKPEKDKTKKSVSIPVKGPTEQHDDSRKKTPNNKRSARTRSEDNVFKMDEDGGPQPPASTSKQQSQRKKKPLTQKPQSTPIQPTRILKRGETQEGSHVPPTQQMSAIQLDESSSTSLAKKVATNTTKSSTSMKDFQFNVPDLVGEFSKAK